MAPGSAAAQKNSKPPEDRIFWRVLALTAPFGLAVLLLLPNGLLVGHYDLPSNSMAPDFRAGSHLLTWRPTFGFTRTTYDWFDLPISGRLPEREPDRGDLIVFRPANDDTVYFSRVIGLPGDTVTMTNASVILNGVPLPREPLGETDIDRRVADAFMETLPNGVSYRVVELEDGPLDNTGFIKVAENCVLVLGDNRDSSIDGRDPRGPIGSCVPIDRIIGKVIWHVGPKPLPPPTSRLGGRGLPEWMREGQQ